MDKQARLMQIMTSIKEYAEAEDQGRYGVELALKTREYWHMAKCAQKLSDIQLKVEDLNIEAKSIQEAIELEAREELL